MSLTTLGDLKNKLGKNSIYIPLYQRNYKWDNNMVEKLTQDIIKNYQENKELNLGMITCKKDGNKIQIIDGQQRLITLSLIIKVLNKTSDWIKIHFERDPDFGTKEGICLPRHNFIYKDEFNCTDEDDSKYTTDVKRMRKRTVEITNVISKNIDIDKDKLYRYILTKVKILYHETKREAVDEFLNMNFNKTPFCAADYIKAQMIFDADFQDTEINKITIADIMKLWKKLQHILYKIENTMLFKEDITLLENEMFQLIKQNYKHYDKNRMEVLFEDKYYNGNNIEKDNYYDGENPLKKEFETLEKYYFIMKSLLDELYVIDANGNPHPNYTAYSAYNLLCKKKKEITFFKIFENEMDINKTLYREFNLTRESYYKIKDKYANINQFMEAMLISEKTIHEKNKQNSQIIEISRFEKKDFSNFRAYQSIFEEKLSEYAEIINVSKKRDEKTFNGKNSNKVTLGKLLDSPEIKQIKIPQVQRDYVMGNNFDYLTEYLRKIRYREICIKWEKYKQDKNDKNEMLNGYEKILDKEIMPLENLKQINNWIYSFDQDKREKASEIKGWIKNNFLELEIEKDTNAKKICKDGSIPQDGRMFNKEISRPFEGILSELKKMLGNIKTKNVDCYNEEAYRMNTSCIMGYLDEGGTFWVYDGQQRITTSIILLAFQLNKLKEEKEKEKWINLLRKFTFEGREGANRILESIINNNKSIEIKKYVEDNTSYAIYKLWKHLECAEKDSRWSYSEWAEFIQISHKFLLYGMDFELILLEKVQDAEQLFMEMNEGLKLKKYEEYKAKLFHKVHDMKDIEVEYKRKFLINLDNEWLDAFQSEENEVEWLKYCVEMSQFEYNGYREDKSNFLESIDKNVLELIDNAMKWISSCKKRCVSQFPPTEEMKKILFWTTTLNFSEDNSRYKKKNNEYIAYLTGEDLVDFFEKLDKFTKKEKTPVYKRCFEIIKNIRKSEERDRYIHVVERKNEERIDNGEVIDIEYNLIKNRATWEEFDNIKKWEDKKEKLNTDFCQKDYFLSETKKLDLKTCFENRRDEDCSEKTKNIIYAFDYGADYIDYYIGRSKKEKYEEIWAHMDKLIQDIHEKFEDIDGLNNIRKDYEYDEENEAYKYFLRYIPIEVGYKEVWDKKNDNREVLIDIFIKRGYYTLKEGEIQLRVSSEEKLGKLKENAQCLLNEDKDSLIYKNYKAENLLSILKNCREEFKESVREEIAYSYIKKCKESVREEIAKKYRENYRYQTRQYIKKSDKDSYKNWCNAVEAEYEEDIPDDILKILPREGKDGMTNRINKQWKEYCKRRTIQE